MRREGFPYNTSARAMRGVGLCVLLLLVSGSNSAAASQTEPLRVPAASSEIVVDGTIDEPAWAQALTIGLDYEVRPGENVAPPVKTICLVTYDERHVYFAFRAHDPEPGAIRARFSDRDEAWNDDWVGIVLDTFNDQRRAYELLSNPLGVQIDAINDDVGGNYDDSWNAIWKSSGRITDSGYEVEMAVPFSQIRFQPAEGDQVWGFDAVRSYPRGDRHHIGIFPRDRGSNSYLSQTVKLVGMRGARPGGNLEVIPTLTAARNDARASLDADLEEVDSAAELGMSLRFGITPNLSLNGALNPDFSQVEADAVQLDVNETFALFFPETRSFFLEGADYFNTQLELVHTRTVVDPSAAAKLTGKQGRHTTGFFVARDERTSIIFPGSEGSSAGSFRSETTDTVGRYRFDFGKSSTVGATITDRRGGGYSNTVVSADTVYRLTDADTLEVSAARTDTKYSEEMIAENDVRAGRFDDTALALNYNHSERGWWTSVRYDDFGEGYRSDMGFRPQVDVRRWDVSGARVWWGDDSRPFNRMAWGASINHAENQQGGLLREEVRSWLNYNGPKQSFGSVWFGDRNRAFEGVEYDQQYGGARFDIQPSGMWSVGIRVERGDDIDFTHNRAATRAFVRPTLRLNVGRHLLLRYSHTYSELEVDGGRLFAVHAPEMRIVYQFNGRAYVRGILQYLDIERNPALYADPVDETEQDLLAQLLFTYKLGPETALYVGYTDNYVANDQYDWTQAQRSFFLKLSYAWTR